MIKFLRKLNIANRLSFIRILLIPFFMVVMFKDTLWTRLFSFIIFIAASITDTYDGILARKYNNITKAGVIIDPIADKILVTSAFIYFVSVKELSIPAWMVVLIVIREYLVTGLRLVVITPENPVSADLVGKIKTTSQITVIIIIFIILIFDSLLKTTGNEISEFSGGYKYILWLIFNKFPLYLMFLVTVITVYSGYVYFKKYWNEFLKNL